MRTFQWKRWMVGKHAAPFVALLPLLAGCEEDAYVTGGCRGSLYPPADVYSVTGDDVVHLYWTHVQPDRVAEYVVYRAPSANGPYTEIGHTRGDGFTDVHVTNGHTYFYAVSSLDDCGYESELSPELVHDTPRPEGFGARIHDGNGRNWERSGWSFSGYYAVPWDHPEADVYAVWVDGIPYLVATDLETDVQDAGFADFDVVGWAPDGGWSPSGAVEAIPGHVYLVWTRDNHFAKVRVVDVSGDRITFDWAYQTDRGNPELGPRPGRSAAPLAFRPAVVRSSGSVGERTLVPAS